MTDPTGGASLTESDDSYARIAVSGGNTVAIYTSRTNVLYVGSNGYLTMNSGDTSLTPTYASHFSLPRVSALYRDLNPSIGGTVSWKQLADHIALALGEHRGCFLGPPPGHARDAAVGVANRREVGAHVALGAVDDRGPAETGVHSGEH